MNYDNYERTLLRSCC